MRARSYETDEASIAPHALCAVDSQTPMTRNRSAIFTVFVHQHPHDLVTRRTLGPSLARHVVSMAHELPRTIQTILIGAAQIIRTRGWCRGTLLDERGAVCLLGAIFEAGTGNSAVTFYGDHEQCDALTNAAFDVVDRLINARFGGGEGRLTIPGWNDLPARTTEDVLQILDDAAAIV